MGTLFVDNIKHQSSQGSGTITVGASGEKVDLGTGVSGGTLTNRPAFEATTSVNQSISDNVTTKITFDGTAFDTDNAFNTSNSTFVVPTGKGGVYYLRGQARCPGADDGEVVQIQFKKNDNSILKSLERRDASATNQHKKARTSILEQLAEGDVIDLHIYQNSGGSQTLTKSEVSFEGFRLIGA
tara:strand:+ start:62 stop:613 length:552 start_codon:yes stop_codon:yes gene_type:complete